MTESTEPITNRGSRKEATARDDRLEILQMVETGAISAADAAQLLDALERTDRPTSSPEAGEAMPLRRSSKHVRFQVSDENGTDVNLTLPVDLIDAGFAIVRKVLPSQLGDLEAIRQAVKVGLTGKILEINGENGEYVSIKVE